MATVTNLDGTPITGEERLRALRGLGMTTEIAQFIASIEDGEISGDLVEIDQHGNERVPEPDKDRLSL